VWKYFCSALVLNVALLSAKPLVAGGPVTTRLVSQGAILKVTRERLCQGNISPFQGGQFIEYLCALTPSMIAENSGPPPPAFAGFAGKGRRRGGDSTRGRASRNHRRRTGP